MTQLDELKEAIVRHIKSFDEDSFNKIARETSFVQRSTNSVSGKDFAELMSVDHFDNGTISLEGLCDILRQKSSETDITPQALCDKINTENAVAFLERTFEAMYKEQLGPKLDKIPLGVLDRFSNVYLQDSTQVELHEHLSENFKGPGGSASKSSLKIDLLYEVMRNTLKNIFITNGTEPDQKIGVRVSNRIKEGDLIIRDLGYFDISVLKSIQEKEAYYLSRLFKGAKVYSSSEPSAEAIDLVSHVKREIGNRGFMEMEVYVGQERLRCRLITYRTPEHIVNERRRKAKRTAQRKGRTLTQEYLEWLTYSFYITNVEAETWPPEIVGTIYRIRWQIELIFKQWKQLFRIDVIKGIYEERIKCILYGRLIVINMVAQIYAFSAWYCYRTMEREVSAVKLIQWLQRNGRLCQSIVNNKFSTLIEELVESLPKGLLKQERQRKTTFELIGGEIGFLESFS